MCWAIRTSLSGILRDDPLIAAHNSLTVGSGRGTFAIHLQGGHIVATAMRYGMIPPGRMGRRDMFWNARSEKIDKVSLWTRLNRQRCVVPISGYCENRPAETWMSGPDAYLLGLYDTDERDGGLVSLTESDGTATGRRPIVTNEAGALAWLHAQQWDLANTMSGVARVQYSQLDLFESKRLSVDVRHPRRSVA
ncbi:SOS response-associated peptidase family protein [Sphingomonas sp. 3-13AW]|uniref:SOS response-associated peptidase family protein n=1 Tax=Sphingomonas sp. 3-13AW TaxID=3050450 RepID=UPI003BB5215A